MRAGAVLPLTTIVRMTSSADCVRTRTALLAALDAVAESSVTSLVAPPPIWPDASHSDIATTMPAEISQDLWRLTLPCSIFVFLSRSQPERPIVPSAGDGSL